LGGSVAPVLYAYPDITKHGISMTMMASHQAINTGDDRFCVAAMRVQGLYLLMTSTSIVATSTCHANELQRNQNLGARGINPQEFGVSGRGSMPAHIPPIHNSDLAFRKPLEVVLSMTSIGCSIDPNWSRCGIFTYLIFGRLLQCGKRRYFQASIVVEPCGKPLGLRIRPCRQLSSSSFDGA
jgi:hypothetical protein